tara:strand:+ start:229 stop:594 length:366 start_codon:yes stop_codon:yes gene_type:complete
MSEYKPDPQFESPIPGKKAGAPKAQKVPPKKYPKQKSAPNEDVYPDVKPVSSQGSTGRGGFDKSSGISAPANAVEAIYNTLPGRTGKSSIDELPGQDTKPIKVPSKKQAPPMKTKPSPKGK